MLCSDFTRCDKFDLIEIDSVFICKSCNVIFHKQLKVVIPCCNRRLINYKTNIPYCKNCNKVVYV